MRFVLNDVSANLMDGKIFQTVQTGTCEAKGYDAPCGGGGRMHENRKTVSASQSFRLRVILPTGIYNAQACSTQGIRTGKTLEHYFRYKIILQVTRGKSVELAIDDFQFPSCCNCHLRL